MKNAIDSAGQVAGDVTCCVVHAPPPAITIGVPMPFAAIRLLQPGSTQPVGGGCVGELVVCGVTVAAGYVKLTADGSGFFELPEGGRAFRTGDLAGRTSVCVCL